MNIIRQFTSPGELGYRQDAVAKHNVIVAGMTEGSGTTKRLMCSSMSLQDAVFALSNDTPSGWKQTGLISYDGLYCPYSTDSGSLLPHFEYPTANASRPTINDLNPLGSGYARTTTEFVISGNTITDDTTLSTKDDNWFDARKVRAVSLKAPLVLTGWGFDKNDKPVPNENPSTPNNNFEIDYPLHPEQWKSGPVDLRWDDERKVWIAGSFIKLGVIVRHSGAIDGSPLTGWTDSGQPRHRPRYAIRMVNLNVSGDMTYQSLDQVPFPSGSDILTFNIQEGKGDVHTIGLGSPVLVYSYQGVQFISEMPGSFANRVVAVDF